jgi:uncharacterized protein (TIGR03435 family)
MSETMRRTILVCSLVAELLAAQETPGVSPELHFEVVSLKPSTGDRSGAGIRPAAGGERYIAVNCPLRLMIQVAWRVKAEQIVGGPAWLANDRFDMEARAGKPSSTDELHVMLMNMLRDRLHLSFHHESKEMPVYALTIDKAGPKLTPHPAANAGQVWIDQTEETMLHVKLKATSSSMNYFAFRLGLAMERPVIDLTGLEGDYDFTLEYTRQLPPDFPPGGKLNGEEPDTSGPTIFAALKQQLGLDLRPQKGQADVIVIDHIEKPTEN